MRKFSTHLLLASTGTATALRLQGSSPLSKVVSMLETTLKDMIEERNLKEKAFEKQSCLAKKTTEKNNDLIKESQANIDDDTNEISLLGSVTLTDEGRVLAGKIDQKKQDITALVQELDDMTAAHKTHTADLSAGIAALMDAESQIQGKTFLVQKSAMISKVLTSPAAIKRLDYKQQQYVQSFLSNTANNAKQAPKAYSSQVGAITELIVNLKNQYQKENMEAVVAFKKNEKAQNAMIAEANQALSTLQAEFEAGEGEAAAKQKRKEELTESIAAATKMIKDAKAENEEMRLMLEDETKNWQIYLEDSTNQESAVNKAIEILSNDDARATFQTEHDNRSKEVFFLQLQESVISKNKSAAKIKEATYSSVSLEAQKSAAIATLRSAIADMKSELEEEKDNIISSVDKCEKDALNYLEQSKQLSEQMDGFQANINSLEKRIESEKEKQAKFTEEITERMAEREEALKVYNERMADLQKIESDLMAAVSIVTDAISALNEYAYQAGGKSSYHEDGKTNPLAGVITMLENIKTDMQTKIKARKTEMTVATTENTELMTKIGHVTKLEDPEDQFVPQIKAPDSLIGDLEAERNASITAMNDAQTSLNADTQSLNSNRVALYGVDGNGGVLKAFNEIQPGCDYWMVNAPGRKEAIAAEIASLLQADTILSNQDLGMASEDLIGSGLGSRARGADKQDHEFDFVGSGF